MLFGLMPREDDTPILPFKLYLRDYAYTFVRRRKLSQYMQPVEVKDNYIFHASTLWYDKGTHATTNRYRGDFLEVCREAGLTIEGGLYYLTGESVTKEFPQYTTYLEEYKDFLYTERISMDDYLKKTQQSVLVFNTPSVCSCHGWKLPEYLCMGKAIVSVPLTRELPGEGLVHGRHIHIVNSKEEMLAAVKKISTDADYRHQLEHGAREYFEKYLAPPAVVSRIIEVSHIG